ncbi:hypothetical protein [Jeotgalibacillus sp. R-1-5s-1]|uniref:hypothetical protein n=1 Tax=Jeotgalibacillus sp. R-1-5s-1 TaxID=2555897 RepID=UPI00106D692E|nr:hypothetical protein [Jeotgalibacillus sp. R-1-5s-1]TFD97028.1 hypothetical protein E2491_10045 [Jeotgalibacillus sp. R-1-5s-1]
MIVYRSQFQALPQYLAILHKDFCEYRGEKNIKCLPLHNFFRMLDHRFFKEHQISLDDCQSYHYPDRPHLIYYKIKLQGKSSLTFYFMCDLRKKLLTLSMPKRAEISHHSIGKILANTISASVQKSSKQKIQYFVIWI